ncbi:flagellar biosynthesis protein FlhB [Immundisolibacter sp.]
MAEESAQERTEKATPKRLQDARNKGQVARSRELNSAALVLLGAGGLWMLGERIGTCLQGVLRSGLAFDRVAALDPTALSARLARASGEALFALAPWLALVLIVAALAPLMLGGFLLSADNLQLKLERLDPAKGLKRVFSVQGAVETGKALGKFVVVGGLAALVMSQMAPALLNLGGEPVPAALLHSAELTARAFFLTALGLLLIAAVDVPFQLWNHAKQLRMTRQDIKDEMKESEGRPEVRGRIRQRQQELSRRRMMQDVPTASVVVTNPTHYAIALRYDVGGNGAPRLVAKGADLVAAQIRALAKEHNVPILEQPPLARALFYSTKIGAEVPRELYTAVAQVLAYVYQLRTMMAAGHFKLPELQTLTVPEELQRPRGGVAH